MGRHVVPVQVTVFWDVTSYSLVEVFPLTLRYVISTCDFFMLTSGVFNRNTFLLCYETCPSAGRNYPVPKIQREFKRQPDEEEQYFNSYVINLDSTCRLNK